MALCQQAQGQGDAERSRHQGSGAPSTGKHPSFDVVLHFLVDVDSTGTADNAQGWPPGNWDDASSTSQAGGAPATTASAHPGLPHDDRKIERHTRSYGPTAWPMTLEDIVDAATDYMNLDFEVRGVCTVAEPAVQVADTATWTAVLRDHTDTAPERYVISVVCRKLSG